MANELIASAWGWYQEGEQWFISWKVGYFGLYATALPNGWEPFDWE